MAVPSGQPIPSRLAGGAGLGAERPGAGALAETRAGTPRRPGGGARGVNSQRKHLHYPGGRIIARPPMTIPLRLTDAQITTIMALSRPLSPDQRVAFLEMLVSRLNDQRELGDGEVYRLCRELQKEFFSPPQFNTDHGVNRSRV